MIQINVFFNSALAHFNQLFCGLELLKREKEISVKYQYAPNLKMYGGIIKILIDDKTAYVDVQDSNKFDKTLYEDADIYFKRMLLKTDAEKFPKLSPYGLNYSVMAENHFLKYIFLKNKKFIKLSLKYHWLLSAILNMNDSIANCYYKKFERKPQPKLENRIVFSTRLWDPDRNDETWKKKERKILNDQRVSIIRKLKKNYSNLFSGGIFLDPHSKRICSDIIVSKSFSDKKKYLNLLKKATITVTNQGLEGSIGWKFAEYIANASAILTTPIDEYMLLGNLVEGTHYLSYTSEEEFLK